MQILKTIQLPAQMLKTMLCARGIRIRMLQLEKFLVYIKDTCPWFPEEGTINSSSWERVGKQLRERFTAEGLENVPIEMRFLWGLVRDSLAEDLKTTPGGYEKTLPQGWRRGEE